MAVMGHGGALDLETRLRQRVGGLVVENFFRGIASAGRLFPQARPERHQVEVLRDVPYLPSGLEAHRLDIYRPMARSGPRPIVLYVHGGGFRILSKDSHWLMGLLFARRGYIVYNISYRLAPQHPYPSAVEDACAAFAWVVANAAQHGGDPSRLVLAGESAGANLALALAIAASYARPEPYAARVHALGVVPRAVVPACGILQVSDPTRFSRNDAAFSPFMQDRINEVAEGYIGGVEELSEEALAFADPLVFLERRLPPARPLPPFFVPVGRRDPVLPDSLRLGAALNDLGVRCETRVYRGHHAFHAFIFTREAQRCWQEKFTFLDRVLSP